MKLKAQIMDEAAVGRALMRIGLRFVLEGDMDSRVVVIKKIK